MPIKYWIVRAMDESIKIKTTDEYEAQAYHAQEGGTLSYVMELTPEEHQRVVDMVKFQLSDDDTDGKVH